MKGFLNITKALADESRLRMLLALEGGELCVCIEAPWWCADGYIPHCRGVRRAGSFQH